MLVGVAVGNAYRFTILSNKMQNSAFPLFPALWLEFREETLPVWTPGYFRNLLQDWEGRRRTQHFWLRHTILQVRKILCGHLLNDNWGRLELEYGSMVQYCQICKILSKGSSVLRLKRLCDSWRLNWVYNGCISDGLVRSWLHKWPSRWR